MENVTLEKTEIIKNPAQKLQQLFWYLHDLCGTNKKKRKLP